MSSIAERISRRNRIGRVNYNETALFNRSFESSSEKEEYSESSNSSEVSESEMNNATDSDASQDDESSSSPSSPIFATEFNDDGIRRSTRKRKQIRYSSDSDTETRHKKKGKNGKKAVKKKRKRIILGKRRITRIKKVARADYDSDDTQSFDFMSEPEEEQEDSVQNIIGQKDVFTDHVTDNTDTDFEDNNIEYYVKFHNKSYIHCKWLKSDEILQLKGGDGALRRWKSKTDNVELAHSLSYPSLLTLDEYDVSSLWFEVDRIIDEAGEGDKRKYHVKWKGLNYDESTWEKAADIPQEKINQFHKRLDHSNPIKIPSKYVKPPASSFKPIETPISNNSGDLTLRDYQMEGFNWLRYCWYEGRNSILADEMGLGKTVQIVTAINDLAINEGITGPFLVIAPLSTLPHWQMEFERWTHLNVVVYHGNQKARDLIKDTEFVVVDEDGRILRNRIQFDVLITNYETVSIDFKVFSEIEWRYLVLDEAHKLKNSKGKLYAKMEQLIFEHCVMLTGTPIQNNVEELWGLLHFLYPNKFNDLDDFSAKYGNTSDSKQIEEIQAMIRPIMLRRRKNDVEKDILPKEETIIEVELTRQQKTFYRAFLYENAATLLQQITGGALPSLMNLMMQLRKTCNHPYLIQGAEDSIVKQKKEQYKDSNLDIKEIEMRALIESSGKMILIDKLLPKLRKDGHKVLIFSQMVRVLDILEDYLIYKNYPTERIDGSTGEIERQTAIDKFNSDENAFVFLLSTRAGGVGINLTSADIVIIYDSDWNPQNDIQAEARCHRIGQKSKVKVYRLITKDTYEYKMFERASRKLGLDHLILEGASEKENSNKFKANEIEDILRNGVHGIFKDDDTEIDNFCSADIDQILERRVKNFKEDVVSGGGSIFAKAQFSVGDEKNAGQEDNNGKTSANNFWKDVLSFSEGNNFTDQLSIRRCKRKQLERSVSTESLPIRKAIKQLTNHGYRKNDNEFEVVRYALKFIEIVNEEHQKLIVQTFGDLPDDEESKEDDNSVNSEMAYAIETKADVIVDQVLFFLRLKKVLIFLQQQDFTWPLILPSWKTPTAEYGLMLGYYRYGKHDVASKISQDDDLGLKKIKIDQRGFISKRVMQLVEEFEQQIPKEAYDTKMPDEFEPMLPKEWIETHPNATSRVELYESEVSRLINSLLAYGLPRKPGDINHVDWERLKDLSQLSLVSVSAVKQYALSIVKKGQALKNQDGEDKSDETKDSNKLNVDISDVSEQILKRVASSVENMDKIIEFNHKIDQSYIDILKKMPRVHGIKWWNCDCDIALIHSVVKHGFAKFACWMLDDRLPFRSHIPDEAVEAFGRAAEAEKVKQKRFNMANESIPPELIYLSKEKHRLSRILSDIKFVESKLAKSKNKKENSSTKKNAEEKSQKPISEIHDLSTLKYPFKISNNIKLLNIGELPDPYNRRYDSKTAAYPVGYEIERKYKYKTWKKARTFRAGIFDKVPELIVKGPIFKVEVITDEPLEKKVFFGNKPPLPWKEAIETINAYIKQTEQNDDSSEQKDHPQTNEQKEKDSSDKIMIPGITLYGLTHPSIIEALALLPNSIKYNALREHSESKRLLPVPFVINIPYISIPNM